MIKVIDQPWVPLHETTKYLSEAEVLPDFLPHLTGGIEELKTTPYGCNFLTLVNEVQQFHEVNMELKVTPEVQQHPIDNVVLTTSHSSSDFMTQISVLNQKLNQQGHHPMRRQGIFHQMGLVKFAAYKWLNKVRKGEPGRIQFLP